MLTTLRKVEGASTAYVRGEPRVYDDPSNSWTLDLAAVKMGTLGVPLVPMNGYDPAGALDRINRYSLELEHEIRANSPEGQRAVRCISERYRRQHGTDGDLTTRDHLAILAESRAVSTASTSLGTLAPPQYLLDKWVAWKAAFAPLANQAAQDDSGRRVCRSISRTSPRPASPWPCKAAGGRARTSTS